LLSILPQSIILIGEGSDKPTWEWDAKRTFSVYNAYYRINERGLRCPFPKVIWKIKAPLKVKAFFWPVVNRAILT